MAPPLHFYFDFISPYGYFASLRIEEIAARHGRTVEWHAMLLGISVMKVMGLKPLLQTPLKGDYVRRDVRRHMRRLGLEIARDIDAPVPSPLAMARAFCWVKQHVPAAQGAMAHAVYDAHWRRGLDLATPEDLVAQVSLPVGVDADTLLQALRGDEPATLLRQSVQSALDAGVFGSPTVVVDGEPFWGVDRLPDVDAWLAGGGW